MAAPSNEQKPAQLIQIVCLVALVMLVAIDAFSPEEFEVPFIVYAIIAGVLFGVGNIKNILGGSK